MTEILMPKLSDSMAEGVLLTWLVEAGQEVQVGEELAEIETDKATATYESPAAGRFEMVAEAGTTLPVGELIARVGAAAPERRVGETRTRSRAETDGPAVGLRSDGRPKASPVARRTASSLGLDLTAIPGTGPGGRIVKRDVEAAAVTAAGERSAVAPEQPESAPALAGGAGPTRAVACNGGARGDVEVVELTRLQQTVARRMAESKATQPDFALDMRIDCSRIVELRSRMKELDGEAPSVNDFLVRAGALALRRHPRLNGSFRDGRVEIYSRVNIGIAVAADQGLLVPTIFDADQKSVATIAQESRRLAGSVRDGTIAPAHLSGGTFAVSNLGMYGVSRFTAVINPPQAAILAAGAIEPLAAVRDGALVELPTMQLTLSCDHRILDGSLAARFLQTLQSLLEEPLRML